MWIFGLLGVAAAVGFYEYVVKPNLASSQIGGPAKDPGNPAFTAGGKIRVGDVVTVAIVSVDPNKEPAASGDHTVQSETVLMSKDNAAQGEPVPTLSDGDEQILESLDQATSSGGTVDLIVTATGLSTPDVSGAPSVPISIGVIQLPGLSARLPGVFLNASVQRIVRNGQVIP